MAMRGAEDGGPILSFAFDSASASSASSLVLILAVVYLI